MAAHATNLNAISKGNDTSGVNTTFCHSPDTYELHVDIDLGWFNEWMNWEGGIAFQVLFWFIISFVILVIVACFKKIKSCSALNARKKEQSDSPEPVSKKPGFWSYWFGFAVDENAVGPDGATYLSFHLALIRILAPVAFLASLLVGIHYYDNKLDEHPKTLRSTGLNNSGVTGTHAVFCSAMLVLLVLVMNNHGKKRRIRSLASFNVDVTDSIKNLRCLLVSGIHETCTSAELYDYLKTRFNFRGMHLHGITMAQDITTLNPLAEEWKSIQDIKKEFTEPDLIRVPRWKFWSKEYVPIGAYFKAKEDAILTSIDAAKANLQFTGMAFILFDTTADAKAARLALRQCQSYWFTSIMDCLKLRLLWSYVTELFGCCLDTKNQADKKTEIDNSTCDPSQWRVVYAPPGSEINWPELKSPRSFWGTLAVLIVLGVVYLLYIILMAAPGTIVRWLHLESDSSDAGSMFWKRFVLPTIVSFFTTKLTDWVTSLDRYRHHVTVTTAELSSLRSVCYMEVALYMLRTMAMKPLPLLLAGQFSEGDFRWECLFFPIQGSFVACCIVVNTASHVLMDHGRFRFLLLWSWSKFLKCFGFRSDAEHQAYKKCIAQSNFDFATYYAELLSNFILIMMLILVFPVIGIVAFVCAVVRFCSDRSALMNVYEISQTGHDLHKESVNIALGFALTSPLALLGYRWIQLKRTELNDAALTGPMWAAIGYGTYLVIAYFIMNYWWEKTRTTFLSLTNNAESNEVKDDEENVTDSGSNVMNEYDQLGKLLSDLKVNGNV